MADNCQYCGGRLKKLHPAHEVFCRENPGVPRLNKLVKAAVPVTLPVTHVTPAVTLVTLDVANESPADRVKRRARERQQRKRAKA